MPAIRRLFVEKKPAFAVEALKLHHDLRELLGLGALGSTTMGIPGEEADGVVAALDFLAELELAGDVSVGDRVAVVGDGFAAVEACRIAVRKGAKEITCLSGGPRDEMSAPADEVDAALEEGVRWSPATR